MKSISRGPWERRERSRDERGMEGGVAEIGLRNKEQTN